jgi:hypothetical protein
MLPLVSAAPTTAERIRSACVRAGGALLAVEGEDPVATPVHHLLRDGSFAVAVPVDPPRPRGGASGSQALLELTDHAPLPVREPVRSLVWVRPFGEIESALLWHLATAHDDVVARLVSRLPAPLRRGQVHPLGLDRYGVRFRIEDTDGDHDIRLPFHKPVDDMTGLSQAIRVLMGCPFLNGLRGRHVSYPGER